MWPGPSCMPRAEAYPHAKFPLNPSSRLATITNVTNRQDRETGKRSDCIGRIVLQMVAQKRETTRKFTV